MDDHTVALFQQQIQPLLLKAAVIKALRLYHKYARSVARLDHIRKKRVLRKLYNNLLKQKRLKQQRLDKMRKAKQYRVMRCFRVFKQMLLRKRINWKIACEHSRQAALLWSMKLLWINTTGLRKIAEKRAAQFRKRKLLGKVLACLFVSKCKA